MTYEERDSIIARSQLQSEQEINDYVALTGAKLAMAAGLKLDLKTIALLGICALNQLPKTPEDALLESNLSKGNEVQRWPTSQS